MAHEWSCSLLLGWMAMVDEVWVTSVPESVAVERIVERNRVTPQEAIERIRTQVWLVQGPVPPAH